MNNQSRNRLRQDLSGRESQSRQRGNNYDQWSQQGSNSPYSGNTSQWRERNEDRDYNNRWRPFDNQEGYSQTPGESRYSGMQNRQHEPGDQGYNGHYGSYDNRHTDSSNEWEQQNDFGSSNRSNSDWDYRNNYNTEDYNNRYNQYDRQDWGNQQRSRGQQGRAQSNQNYLSNHGSQFNERGNDNPQGNWRDHPQQRYDNSYGRQDYSSRGNQQSGSRMGSYGSQYGNQGSYSQGSESGYDNSQGSWWQQSQQQSNRGRGPKGYTRSDERITESINDQLADDIYLDASDIEVQVINGEVILSGTVESRQNKRYVEDLVESISGIKNVENRLRLKSNEEGNDNNRTNTNNKENESRSITGNTANTNNHTGSDRSNSKVKATQE